MHSFQNFLFSEPIFPKISQASARVMKGLGEKRSQFFSQSSSAYFLNIFISSLKYWFFQIDISISVSIFRQKFVLRPLLRLIKNCLITSSYLKIDLLNALYFNTVCKNSVLTLLIQVMKSFLSSSNLLSLPMYSMAISSKSAFNNPMRILSLSSLLFLLIGY